MQALSGGSAWWSSQDQTSLIGGTELYPGWHLTLLYAHVYLTFIQIYTKKLYQHRELLISWGSAKKISINQSINQQTMITLTEAAATDQSVGGATRWILIWNTWAANSSTVAIRGSFIQLLVVNSRWKNPATRLSSTGGGCYVFRTSSYQMEQMKFSVSPFPSH